MTAWTDFVRKWATENKVSFKEALKSAKMKDEYHKANPKKQKTTKSKKPKIAYKPQPLQQMKSPSGLAGQAQQSIAKEIQKEEKPLQVQVPTLKEALKQPIPTPSDDTTGLTPADLRNATQRIVKKGKRLVKPTQDVPSFIQTEQKRPAPKIVMESLEEGFPPMRNMRLSDLSDDNLDLGDDIGITIKEVQKSIDEDVEQITPTGKGIRFGEMKNLLKSSYQKKRQDVGDWKVDTALSRPEAQVYSKDGEAVVVHRGTHRLADWGTNLAMTFGITTDRMKRAREVQRKAESKYGKENITTLGHSLGAKLAEDYGAGTKQIATLNKPTLPLDVLRGKSVPEKQTDIKTSGDPVSILRGLQKGKKAVNISSKTYNPLLEHSTETLSRLPQEALVGGKVYENLDVFEYDDKMDTQEIWNMIDDIRARIDILIERRENLTEALDNAERVSQETGRRLKPEWVKKVKDRINDIKQEIRELDSDLEELDIELVRRRTRRRPEQEEDEMYENQEETNINNINIEGTGNFPSRRNRRVYIADDIDTDELNRLNIQLPVAQAQIRQPITSRVRQTLRGVPQATLIDSGLNRQIVIPDSVPDRLREFYDYVDMVEQDRQIRANNSNVPPPPSRNSSISSLGSASIPQDFQDMYNRMRQETIEAVRQNMRPPALSTPRPTQDIPSVDDLLNDMDYDNISFASTPNTYSSSGEGLVGRGNFPSTPQIYPSSRETTPQKTNVKKPSGNRRPKKETTLEEKLKSVEDSINSLENQIKVLRENGENVEGLEKILEMEKAEREQIKDKLQKPETDDTPETNGSGLGSDYKLQSVAFDRKKYTPVSARKWLKENKHKAGKIDTTDTQLRFRQEDPKKVQKAGYTEFRTKELGDKGIQLILAYKK